MTDNKRPSDVDTFISFIVSTACHGYRLNYTGFLVSRDMVRTFNIHIHKFFTQHFSNNVLALNR